MDAEILVGMRVMNTNTRAIGTIEYVRNGIVAVDFYGTISKYSYPAAFAGLLELEDEKLQEEIQGKGVDASFDNFKRDFQFAICNEINYLKSTGGKKYKIIDGERLVTKNGEYLYAFDTDTDLHFPDGTAIKLWFPDNIIQGYVTKAMNRIRKDKNDVKAKYVLDEMMPIRDESPLIYVTDKKASWTRFVQDISNAKYDIHMDIPDVIDDNEKAIKEFIHILRKKKEDGLDICIRLPENIDLPDGLQEYIKLFVYVTNPITIIDKKIIWFGQPLYTADFISEGETVDTEYFPCVRFEGLHAARLIKAFLEI